MMTWQEELREALDRYPGGAERLLKAMDENRISMVSMNTCVYGHIMDNVGLPYEDARLRLVAAVRGPKRRANSTASLSPLEGFALVGHTDRYRHPARWLALRAEVVTWLAEQGSAVGRAPGREGA